MELKATIFAILLIFLLATPCFSTGRLLARSMDSDAYVIDYRGPETHTYFPPPNNRAESKPNVHHQTRKARHYESQVSKPQKSGKKIHGG